MPDHTDGYRVTEPMRPHLPGSVPLADASSVFEWASTLQPRPARIPDGETGTERSLWAFSQIALFANNATLEEADPPDGAPGIKKFRPRPGVEPRFGAFSYAQWARESFQVFDRLQRDQVVDEQARFMVSVPHPIDTVRIFTAPEAFHEVYGAYEERTRQTVLDVCETIPTDRVAIQFDLPEITNIYAGTPWEAFGHIDLSEADALALVVRATSWVPDDAELGLHLCFGDGSTKPGDPHTGNANVLQPPGIVNLVRLANDLQRHITRRIDFLHMPTQADWVREEDFAPLKGLAIAPETDLAIGSINLRRDANRGLDRAIARARERTAAVRQQIGPVGLSTSCGMGRYAPEEWEAAQQLFRELSPVTAP